MILTQPLAIDGCEERCKPFDHGGIWDSVLHVTWRFVFEQPREKGGRYGVRLFLVKSKLFRLRLIIDISRRTDYTAIAAFYLTPQCGQVTMTDSEKLDVPLSPLNAKPLHANTPFTSR